ncbi:MAG: hypothetical protein KGO53_01760 [Alphaproteobacteria bacterium]|nr:hypothetical protein [Alphaproteobacteria bacterium]
MAFWDKWFTSPVAAATPVKTLEYKGFVIEATPYKAGDGWQLSGTILKDGKSHAFVRADRFADKNEAAEFAISKGQLIIDQMGEAIFKS